MHLKFVSIAMLRIVLKCIYLPFYQENVPPRAAICAHCVAYAARAIFLLKKKSLKVRGPG